ncbi:lipopolysaccharide assembly protein LapB [Synechocystis sp. PCC 7338]|uniref:tetratricopeptide repeat protein n=1 Tax=Synechocystis sp. PCC 7338 TaxID=2732530 RepID=UPI001BAF68B7|nr:tetratricopeptide repeat protein [Synechocystis sp. PCC 7338]QUS62010.1 tetratricopeptide repeat protein [Synechocystis sp. PCC 7338]
MATSRTQRDVWVYVGIGAMVSALVLFSLVPLAMGLWQPRPAADGGVNGVTPLENQAFGYQLVLEREPDNVNALQGLLEIRLQQKNLTAAIAPLERLGQIKADQVQYRILLAQLKTQLEDKAGAAKVYREILLQSPYNIQALKGLSGLYAQQERPAEAVAIVQNAITQAIKAQTGTPGTVPPDQLTSLQLLLGEIYLSQNRPDQAIAIYEAASKVNGNDFRPILAQAQVMAQTGKLKEADPFFQQAIMLAPVQYKDSIKKIALQVTNQALANQNSASDAGAPSSTTAPILKSE